GLGERLVGPGPPVDGVVLVLQQVRGGRAGKTVGHTANLARRAGTRRQEAPSTRSGMIFGGAAWASWCNAPTILSAGSGRLKWKPCAEVQPSASNAARWSAVSTPSATTRTPRRAPSSTAPRTTAAAAG